MPKKKSSKPQTVTITITETSDGVSVKMVFDPEYTPPCPTNNAINAAALCAAALQGMAAETDESEE